MQKRSVMLAFDSFGSECLAAESGAVDCTADFLRAAAHHYLAELGRGRLATRVPAFARFGRGVRMVEVGLDLGVEELTALRAEAERQGLCLELLLAHAALLYLADAPLEPPRSRPPTGRRGPAQAAVTGAASRSSSALRTMPRPR
jgi:hypothetical protein